MSSKYVNEATSSGWSVLFAAWVLVTTATLGSLFFSEVMDVPVCVLCWYQRIAMYPLAIVLAIAAIRRDAGVRLYASVLASIGGVIAVYHYVIQWFPNLEGTSCTTSVPCTGVWFRVFGFVSIPYMALSTFALVLVLMMALRANAAEPA